MPSSSNLRKQIMFLITVILFISYNMITHEMTKNDGSDEQVKRKHCLQKRWEKILDEDYVGFTCPAVWPLPSNGMGCCMKAADTMRHVFSKNESWCGTAEQQLRIDGASLLQGRRIFFIGDSVGHHWLNAMLLDAHRNSRLNLLPNDTSIWSRSFNTSQSYYEYDNRGFCAFPFQFLNMSSAWPSAPSLVSAQYPNLLCPPYYKKELYQQCCPSGIPISRTGAISVKLNESKPDIVIAQMGVHYHTVSSYKIALNEMLETLGNYSMLNPGSLVLFLESLPQHFDAPDGSGSYDGFSSAQNRDPWSCLPLNLSHIKSDLSLEDNSSSVGIHNLNRISKRAVMNYHRLRWLPSNSDAFSSRNDGHVGATKCCARHTDCTHYCYSPNLYQPAIEPFYRALDNWFRAGFKSSLTDR